FWPGPLTLVVRASAWIAPQVTAGTGTVGMRQPDLPLLAALLAATGYPLTATSANRSGAPECRTAAAVAEQLGGLLRIAAPPSLDHRGLDRRCAADRPRGSCRRGGACAVRRGVS